MAVKRVLLDTDIGTDVDDLLALALALNSPEISLEGVTTVSLEAEKRAKLSLKVLGTAGLRDTPVFAGLSKPLFRVGEEVWGPYDGHGVDLSDIRGQPPANAVPFLVSRITDSPGELTLLTIGPLTNIAAALVIEPSLALKVKECLVMGGILCKTLERDSLREYNVSSDPEAANIVFNSGLPITMVGLDVTLRVPLDRDRLERIKASGRPLAILAASAAIDYQERVVKRRWNYLHDPLTVAALIDRSLIKTRPMRVSLETKGIETDGWMVARKAAAGSREAVEAAVEVDVERFLAFFEKRLTEP